MKKVAIYARYSSDNQREESIDAQIRALNDFCDKNNYKVVKIYTDEAKSATTDNRPQFQQMIKDSSTGLFEVVLVHKLDRFSRDRFDSAFYKRELKKNDVRLISMLENLDNSPESIILESVLEGMAEYYSANLSREVMKGMKETAYQCKHTGGIPLLGYDVDREKNYIINQLEAEIIRTIFTMYADNKSYGDIISTLEEKGYKTKTGKDFSRSSINNILRNEKYCGTYVFNKTGQKKNGKRNVYNKEDGEVIKIENGIPSIVSKDIWQFVNDRMDKSSQAIKTATRAKEIYLLSGLVRCKQCGSLMVGNRRYCGRNKSKYVTYDCSNRRTKKGCTAKSINKSLIENMVIEFLEDGFFSYVNIDEIANRVLEMSKNNIKGLPQTLNAHTHKLNQIQKQIDNIVSAIANGMFHPSMKDKMDELEHQKSSYEAKIANLKLSLQSYKKVSKDEIVAFLELQKGIKNKSSDKQKTIIQTFIKEIFVHEQHIDITTIVHTANGGEGN